MVKYIVNIFIAILFISLSTKAQVTEIFKLPRENHIPLIIMQYNLALDSIATVKITDSLLKEVKRLGEDREKWYIELSLDNAIHYFQEKRTPNPTYLQTKEQYYLSSPHKDIPIAYFYNLAQSYVRLKDVEKAYHYFFKVENLLEAFGYENMPLIPYITSSLAEFYAQFEDYNLCVKYCKIGMSYKNPLSFTMLSAFGLNNLGFYLVKLKRYEEAEKVFQQVMVESKKDKNNFYEGIGAGNIGNIKRIQGIYKEALPYLYKDLAINETQVKENAATSSLYLAHCLLELDSTAKAKIYIEKGKALASQSYYQSSFFPTYYEVAGLYYKKLGDFKKVNQLKDSLIRLRDSLKAVFDVNTLRITSLREKEVKFVEQDKLAKNKAKNSIQFRNLIIGSIIIIFILIYYALLQKRKKDKIKTAQKEQEAQQTIDLANEKLQGFLAQIKEKNKIIEEYQELKPNTTETEETLPFIQNLLQSVILTDEDWTKFRDIFNQAYPAFLPKLKLDYPNLSPAEIRLVVLQQLPISTKHQASMLGISTASLRTAKYRLRKKYPELLDDNEANEL